MDEQLFTLIRDLGPIGIMAVALYFAIRALRPAIAALAAAVSTNAEAQRELRKRWKDSDDTISRNTVVIEDAAKKDVAQTLELAAHTQAMTLVSQGMGQLTQQQGELVKTIQPLLLKTAEWDVIAKEMRGSAEKMMSTAATIEQGAALVTRYVAQLIGQRDSQPHTQEHHHSGSVSLVPKPSDEAKMKDDDDGKESA